MRNNEEKSTWWYFKNSKTFRRDAICLVLFYTILVLASSVGASILVEALRLSFSE